MSARNATRLAVLTSRKPIAAYEEHTHGVISIRLFESWECRDIIVKLNQLEDWNEALIRQTALRDQYNDVKYPAFRSARLAKTDDVAWLYRDLELRIHRLVKPLVLQLWKVNLHDQSDTQLIKYEPGDHYQPHSDTGIDLEKRYFSVVCYLNDGFAGGRTLFPTLDHAVIPEAGRAVLFPSHYLHGSEPVISGKKFVLVSWLDGPVPIKWI